MTTDMMGDTIVISRTTRHRRGGSPCPPANVGTRRASQELHTTRKKLTTARKYKVKCCQNLAAIAVTLSNFKESSLMKSSIIAFALLLLVFTPPPPAHGQQEEKIFTVSGEEEARRASFGYLKWYVPTGLGSSNTETYIDFTISGSASRAAAKGSTDGKTWSPSTIRRSATHNYYIPPRYMSGNLARCWFEHGWCRIVIWPLIGPSGTKTATFTAVRAWDGFIEQPISVSGTWRFKIKDDNDSL